MGKMPKRLREREQFWRQLIRDQQRSVFSINAERVNDFETLTFGI